MTPQSCVAAFLCAAVQAPPITPLAWSPVSLPRALERREARSKDRKPPSCAAARGPGGGGEEEAAGGLALTHSLPPALPF